MKKRQNNYSIKKQLLLCFGGLLCLWVVTLLILNGRFLESYYIKDKEKTFLELHKTLEEEQKKEGRLERIPSLFLRMAEESNTSFLLIDLNSQAVYTNVSDKEVLQNQLMGYLLDQTQETGRLLSKGKNYVMHQSKDPWKKTDYIEMWGKLGEEQQFLFRSPLESIKESVAISNRFLLWSGVALLGGSLVLIWYFSKRLTEPIEELVVLSKRMSNLDFHAVYQGKEMGEVGELGESFNRMSARLKETIGQLKSANYRLQKDIEEKEALEERRNEFIGSVSHELKTPLALIQGYAEGLKEGIYDCEEGKDFYCTVILEETEKMNQLVKNLLRLHQLELGEEEISFFRFDIVEMILGVVQGMEILAQQEEIRIQVENTTPVFVWGAEYQVEQVLRNYLSNAIHHAQGEKLVRIRVEDLGEKVRIWVRNTGNQIPEKDVSYIWDKFYKIDKARTREYGGNGIGLSIVRATMTSLNQGFGVENEEDGVSFWFELEKG